VARQWAETLKRVRAERDRLRVERDQLGREALKSKSRLLAVQLTLVETEAELDDCRARAKAAWSHRRQEDRDEDIYESDDGSSRFEFKVESLAVAGGSFDPEESDAS
jgi:uncharacterized coiled-coil DUF342 family protein